MKSKFDIVCDTLGDAILPEPALALHAEYSGKPTPIWVANPEIRSLYEHHPDIVLADGPGGKVLDASEAFDAAVASRSYFSTGYFPQVGVPLSPLDRIHCKIYLDEFPDGPSDHVVLCPFSRCCAGRSGGIPNKEAPLEWWGEVVAMVREAGVRHIVSLSGWEDPDLEGTLSMRGRPLRYAAWAILKARLVICLDSWSLHVSGGREGPTIALTSACPPWFTRPSAAVRVIHTPSPMDWKHEQVKEELCRAFSGDPITKP